MQRRRIGETDLSVSVIGLGTVKFGRNLGVKYPHAFSLPSDAEIKDLLQFAADLGINLLDTAPAYGSSEERLGRLLGTKRHEWIISTKFGEEFIDGQSVFNFSDAALHASVCRSLKALRTDYLDILLVHSDGDDERIIDGSIFLKLDRLKREGKIRAYGMSTKTVRGGLRTIDAADLAMVTLNTNQQDESEVVTHAWAKKKGIFIKKALASGHLQTLAHEDPIFQTMRFIFSHPGVTSVIVGTLNSLHLKENVEKVLRILNTNVS